MTTVIEHLTRAEDVSCQPSFVALKEIFEPMINSSGWDNLLDKPYIWLTFLGLGTDQWP